MKYFRYVKEAMNEARERTHPLHGIATTFNLQLKALKADQLKIQTLFNETNDIHDIVEKWNAFEISFAVHLGNANFLASEVKEFKRSDTCVCNSEKQIVVNIMNHINGLLKECKETIVTIDQTFTAIQSNSLS